MFLLSSIFFSSLGKKLITLQSEDKMCLNFWFNFSLIYFLMTYSTVQFKIVVTCYLNMWLINTYAVSKHIKIRQMNICDIFKYSVSNRQSKNSMNGIYTWAWMSSHCNESTYIQVQFNTVRQWRVLILNVSVITMMLAQFSRKSWSKRSALLM